MRILHTSDWHVGRTFHGFDTGDHLREVLLALAQEVRAQSIDAVVIAGDVFDLSVPAARHFDLLTEALAEIRRAGAVIIATAGNHDSAARLGFLAPLVAASGVHILTRWPAEPVILTDEHGQLRIYGIPYLEPNAVRDAADAPRLGDADGTMRWAMDAVRDDLDDHPARSVVLAHCFVGRTGDGTEIDDDAPRDITVGGRSLVSARHFHGVDYVALGHIHSRQEVLPNVRYSGAPLHYSFREKSPERGGWLVDFGADGVETITWLPLPVPRPLTTITGELEQLLADAELDGTEQHWVRAILTDAQRPTEPMQRLRRRWPNCAHVELRPPEQHRSASAYRERVRERTDIEIVERFVADVRDHEPLTDLEREIAEAALAALQQEAAQ